MTGKLHNSLSERYSGGDYLEKNATWHVEDSPWKARNVIQMLDDNDLVPATVAEVGCGAGEILVSLKRHYVASKFFGYELSPLAYGICSQKSGESIEFHNSDILKSPHKFDVLLCMDVFEHVNDYLGFLEDIAPKARYHVFHIPLEISIKTILTNGMMRQRSAVGHLHYFSAETALATLEDAGYAIQTWRFTAPFERGGVAPSSGKARVANFFRRIFYRVSPRLLSRTLGGCSLLVLCRVEGGGERGKSGAEHRASIE